ncbi:MAG: PemK family protein [Clostridiaceae bacterium]|nr:PemK family protein [Clostridiaceae bacterium]
MEQNLYHLAEKYNIFMNIQDSDKERFKSILSWAGDMMELDVKERLVKNSVMPKKGEVWTVNLGENIGSEVNKVRPCIIVQNNKGNKCSPTTIVLPISHREECQPTHVTMMKDLFEFIEDTISGTSLAEQIRTVSKARLGRKVGTLSDYAVRKINKTIKISLDLE